MKQFFKYHNSITKQRFGSLAILMVLINSSCSSLTINERSIYQPIDKQRDNIVTTNSLSKKSASRLLSAGIDPAQCIDAFNICLAKLEQDILYKDNQEALALFAELHFAKVKDIAADEQCAVQISRPPIDPYYANTPLTLEQKKQQESAFQNCEQNYRTHVFQALQFSYAYLFYDELQPNQNTSLNPNNNSTQNPKYLSNELDTQTQDVYEAAINAFIKRVYKNRHIKSDSNKVAINKNFGSSKTLNSSVLKQPLYESDKLLNILNITFANPQSVSDGNQNNVSVDFYVPNEPEYLQYSSEENLTIDGLYASHDLNYSRLNSISRREGIGVSYVTLLNGRLDTSVIGLLKTKGQDFNIDDPKKRIHLTGNVLASAVIIPKGSSLEDVLNTRQFDLKFYNPHHTEAIDILGNPYYLAANFSASYEMWLAENGLDNVSYFSLLSKQQALELPQLYMLEPYDPNKRVIIMLHGLASSPATWVKITNDISNDVVLRKNYQVWQIFYPTNIPMLENRYQIQRLIEAAYRENDINSENPASHHSVLIGHSMGGVIGRMLLSNDNLESKAKKLAEKSTNTSINQLLKDQISSQNIQNRLHLNKLKPVDEAVFISAPFKGTDFADRWFTRTLRGIIKLPLGFVQTVTGNLANIATEGELTESPLGALYLENGASQLSDKSSFMALTKDLNIDKEVRYHTIIAKQDSDLLEGLKQLSIISTPQTQLANVEESQTIDVQNSSELLNDKNQLISNSIQTNSQLENSAMQNNTNDGINSKESIIGLDNKFSKALALDVSDGIVPYSSAHLDGAASENVIEGDHGIHESPEAVLILRKILHSHLSKHPIKK